MTVPAAGRGFWRGDAPLVLASASPVRAALLARSLIPFEVIPSAIDERALSAGIRDGAAMAETLAHAKAAAVARQHPGRLVLGCDQTLTCAGQLLHKPADAAEARQQLTQLRGRAHRLHAGLALSRDGAMLWRGLAEADMVMRLFSDAFLDAYLHAAGPDVRGSVGVYRYESLGVHLFSSVSGDEATILGLPLLPLLAALRQLGYLAA
jgi:septum formation protein